MSETTAQLIEAYRGFAGKKRSAKKSIEGIRFVCFDAETTSLDPLQAGVVALGAVAIVGGDIQLDDSIELLVRQSYNSSAVTVHGITRQESQAGLEEEEAIAAPDLYHRQWHFTLHQPRSNLYRPAARRPG